MLIRPIIDADLPAVLDVYRQCEDFLALGPDPVASLKMIAGDRELSKQEGGEYCGIFDPQGDLIGIFDFVRSGFEGDAGCAFIELLMIGGPYRNRGWGKKAVEWLKEELRNQQPPADKIKAAVQVNNPAAIQFWLQLCFCIEGKAALQTDGTVTYPIILNLINPKGANHG